MQGVKLNLASVEVYLARRGLEQQEQVCHRAFNLAGAIPKAHKWRRLKHSCKKEVTMTRNNERQSNVQSVQASIIPRQEWRDESMRHQRKRLLLINFNNK